MFASSMILHPAFVAGHTRSLQILFAAVVLASALLFVVLVALSARPAFEGVFATMSSGILSNIGGVH